MLSAWLLLVVVVLYFALLLIFYAYLYQISLLLVIVKGLTTPFRIMCKCLLVCVQVHLLGTCVFLLLGRLPNLASPLP